jgi:CNT family concentrative nucleoside transporter
MSTDFQAEVPASGEPPKPLVKPAPPPTPVPWRVAIAAAVLLVGGSAYVFSETIGPRAQAGLGALCVFGMVATASANLRAVNWRTVGWGVALQVALAVFVLWTEPGYQLFSAIAGAVNKLLDFTARGTRFVFGPLVDDAAMDRVFGPGNGFVFAFGALPVIIFVSSFFTVLYYLGVLQLVVRLLARVMVFLMRTSGAETLSAVANVFMGQAEAPLIVKPYVGRMTQSELLALMVGGMATISGGLMAVYIQMGADRVGILATSVMAAPCGLYLSKLLLPELEEPETRGLIATDPEPMHRNVIDAAAGGASDGLFLALNVAAMLIAFLAFLELVDYLLGLLPTGPIADDGGVPAYVLRLESTAIISWVVLPILVLLLRKPLVSALSPVLSRYPAAAPQNRSLPVWLWGAFLSLLAVNLVLHIVLQLLPYPLSLRLVFSNLFAPVAVLMGVQGDDIPIVADLLGTKLALNEFVAYLELTRNYQHQLSPRAYTLCTYALTGFANFASVGIQLGAIGGMAPHRRPDLARLGIRALFVGFLATVLNAAIAGVLLP